MSKITYFSNEIVFPGHPDKVCDQIGDALLDEYLKQDKDTRAGIEVTGGKGVIFITGEVTSTADVDVSSVVSDVLTDVGYDPDKYKVINNIGKQSPDISQGVDVGGAGDQGMMFGYACRDNDKFLPSAMVILQDISREYFKLTRVYPTKFLPDGKAMLTGVYENGTLISIDTMLVSYNVLEKNRDFTDPLIHSIVCKVLSKHGYTFPRQLLINPTGKFEVGGFDGDAGVLGRKIVVDGYHGFYHVGGGAQSGKDGTKVDRSGAYKARQVALEYLDKYDLEWCEVQISYAIGVKEPMSIMINSDKGTIEPHEQTYIECEPQNIIMDLELQKPTFYSTARYGHFGGDFTWEQVK